LKYSIIDKLENIKEIIVVVDDLEQGFGKFRIKNGGSAKFHNFLFGQNSFILLIEVIMVSNQLSKNLMDKWILTDYLLESVDQHQKRVGKSQDMLQEILIKVLNLKPMNTNLSFLESLDKLDNELFSNIFDFLNQNENLDL